MKRNIFLRTALLACTALLALSSCDKDKPAPIVEPAPSITSDFKPHSITLELYEGHLHGRSFHYVEGAEQVKYARLEQMMKLVWDEASSTYKVATDSPLQRFAVKQGFVYSDSPIATPVYGLLIKYYDANGELINAEIGADGAFQEHQHFFSVSNIKPMENAKPTDPASDPASFIKYYYRDTNPWDQAAHKGATVLEDTNPLGLKGYFTFHNVRKTFDLDVQLWYAPKGAKLAGGIAPFDAPTEALMKGGVRALAFKIPAISYRSHTDEPEIETLDITFDELEDEDKEYIRAYMLAFGITAQEAITDVFYHVHGDPIGSHDHDHGSVWF